MTTESETEATTDPRVLAIAKALQKHHAAEDDSVNDFPDDEYICCAKVALKALDESAG